MWWQIFFFFLQLCLLKKFRICQFYCGLAVDVSSGQPFLCWVQMRRKSHATKTKHTKQNYRVISNLLFKVSVFLNFAHKFQCWVELCLLFIFGESVTIEIENLKKKSPFSPLPWFSEFCPPCSLSPSSLFPCSSFPCFLHCLFLFLFYQQTHILTPPPKHDGDLSVWIRTEHWMNVGLGLGEGLLFHITLFTPLGKVPT